MNPLRLTAALLLALATALVARQNTSTNLQENAAQKIQEVQFSPDGKRIIVASTNGPVRIWDLKTGKPLPDQPAHLGTWQLVTFKYGEETNRTELPQGHRRIKLITSTHFTWVQYEVSTGKVESTAGGTYTLSDGTYTELIEFAGEGMTDYLGKKQPFTIKVEGDKLTQSGQLSDGTKIEEEWRRMK